MCTCIHYRYVHQLDLYTHTSSLVKDDQRFVDQRFTYEKVLLLSFYNSFYSIFKFTKALRLLYTWKDETLGSLEDVWEKPESYSTALSHYRKVLSATLTGAKREKWAPSDMEGDSGLQVTGSTPLSIISVDVTSIRGALLAVWRVSDKDGAEVSAIRLYISLTLGSGCKVVANTTL